MYTYRINQNQHGINQNVKKVHRGKRATREAREEVAFPAGEEEDATGGDLGSPSVSTDDEQRRKAPERPSRIARAC